MTDHRFDVDATCIVHKSRLTSVILLSSLAACGSRTGKPAGGSNDTHGDIWFEDVTLAAGIDFDHRRADQTRYHFPEIMGGGAAWFDYDRDGDLDLYLVQSGDLLRPQEQNDSDRLYRNRGDGTFEDVTVAAGVLEHGYGMGCTVGDYDNDGDEDLYVTNVGPNTLFRNNGDGTFSDVTEAARVGDPSWGTSCAFVDYDADGHLDLYIANYVVWSAEREIECFDGANARDYCSPKDYGAQAHDTLYHNNGDGTFSDVSQAAGIWQTNGYGLGVVVADFNGDGRVDIYVANDGVPNQFWVNEGDGTFRDEAILTGCAVNASGAAEAGMGVVTADVESDGELDIFITHLKNETNTLYRGKQGVFDDVTARSGLGAPSFPYTGFGVGMLDFDHDGWLDTYIANGRVMRGEPLADDPYSEPSLLFKGAPDGRFSLAGPIDGTARPAIASARAAAFADYDEDGDIDIVIVNNGGPARLLRNIAGARGHWSAFRVIDGRGLPAIGAKLEIRAGGRTWWRIVQVAYSYCAANDARVHVGLGTTERVDQVVVLWPDGQKQEFGPFESNAVHELRAGGAARR